MTQIYQVQCDQCGEMVPDEHGPEYLRVTVARHRVDEQQVAAFLGGFGGHLDLCLTCFGALCRHLGAVRGRRHEASARRRGEPVVSKVFCDRCGEEASHDDSCGWRLYVSEEKLDVGPDSRWSYDLCTSCVELVRKFMETAE